MLFYQFVKRLAAEQEIDPQPERWKKYEAQLFEMGYRRNSLSKTDKDATFMRMKEGHMGNSHLNLAYNVQMAVNSEYITGVAAFPNCTDSGTLVPFLNHIQRIQGRNYRDIVADAGTGRRAATSGYRHRISTWLPSATKGTSGCRGRYLACSGSQLSSPVASIICRMHFRRSFWRICSAPNRPPLSKKMCSTSFRYSACCLVRSEGATDFFGNGKKRWN